MADRVEMRVSVDYDYKSANHNLDKLIKRLEKENKLDIIIDTKRFEKLAKEYDKLRAKFEKENIKINLDSEVENLRVPIDKMTQQFTKLSDGTFTMTKNMAEFKNSAYESVKIIENINTLTGRISSVNKVEKYDFTKEENDLKTTIGYYEQLKKSNLEVSDVAKILSREYGNLEIRGKSLNRITGEYSVELKKSAKENLILKGTIDQTNGALRVQSEVVRQAKNIQLGFFEQMKIAMERVPIWLGATTIYFQAFRFGTQLIEDISSINKNMIELAKVTDATQQQLDNFRLKTSVPMAKDLGVLNNEVINVTAEISKLGYSLKDATELTNLSLLAKTVGDLDSVGDSISYLTSIMKGFNITTTEEMSKVVDFLNYTANTTSIDFANLGEGFKRMSASMRLANNTLAESAGLLTAGFDITRNAEKTSTALVTTSMRLRGVSEDGEDLSQLIPELESKFNKFGLSLKKDNNTFKSTFEIYKDLSELFKSGKISDFDKADILEKVAGKRSSQVAAAIIQNMQTAIDVTNKFEESQGSALLEHQRYMQGIEANYNNLINSLTQLNQTLLDSSTIIKAIKFADTFVNNATALGKFSIAIVGISVALGAYVLANKKAILSMTEFNVVSQIGGLKTLGSNIVTATKALLGFKVASDTTTISTTALNIALSGLLVGIPLIAQGIGFLINAQKRMTEAFNESVESMKVQKQEIEVLDALIKTKESLDTIENKSTSQKEKLYEVERKIAELLPNSVTGYDEQNQALAENLDLVKQLTEEKRKQLQTDATLALGQIKNIDSTIQRFDEVKKAREESNKVLQDEALLQQKIAEWAKVGVVWNREQELRVLGELNDEYKTINTTIGDYNKNAKILNDVAGENLLIYDFTTGQLIEYNEALEINTEAQNDNAIATNNNVESQNNLLKTFQSARSKILEIKDAQEEYNKTGAYSIDTVLKLAESYPELLNMLGDEKAINEFLIQQQNDKIKAVEYSYNAQLQGLQTYLTEVFRGYGLEFENFKNLQEAKEALEAQTNAKILAMRSAMNDEDDIQIQKRIMRMLEKSKMIEGSLSTYFDVKNIDLGSYLTSSKLSSSSSSSSAEKNISEFIIESDRYASLNAELERTNSLLAKNKALQENVDNKKRIELLKEEQDLLKQKQQNLKVINDERRKEREELVKNLQQQGVLFEGEGDLIDAKNAELILQNKIDQVNAHRNDKNKSTYNKLKEEYEDLNNQLKRFIELQTKDIPDASTEWWNLEKSINSVYSEITKTTESLAKQYLELQKQVDEIDLKDKIKIHENAIKDLEKEISLNENKLKNLEQQSDLEDEIAERQKRQLEIAQIQERLANVSKERNVHIYTGKGETGWEWVADPRVISDIQEELRDKQEDFYQWEIDNQRKHQIEILQDKIAKDKETIKSEQDKIQALKDTFEEEWKNIELMSEKLLATYGNNLEKAFSELSAKIAKLNSQISTSVTLPSSVASSISSKITSYNDLTAEQKRLVQQWIKEQGGSADWKMAAYALGFKKFDTGGYTQDSEGLAWLDKKEIVLNKFDTSNLLSAVNVLRDLIKPMNIPNLNALKNINTTPSIVNHYSFPNMTVEANDGEEFIRSLKTIFRTS